MSEPVVWLRDGSPHSPRFNDRYRSRSGGVAQAACVFLAGCGLPQRWRGKAEFTVLETGFGLGMNFLTTWAAWEADAQRCDGLHFVSVEAYPVAAADIVRSALAPNPTGEADAPCLHACRPWRSNSPAHGRTCRPAFIACALPRDGCS